MREAVRVYSPYSIVFMIRITYVGIQQFRMSIVPNIDYPDIRLYYSQVTTTTILIIITEYNNYY